MIAHRRVLAAALGLMAVPLLLAVLSFAARSEPPWLETPKAGTTCVLPKPNMRYQHITHLKTLRDRVVRDGLRAEITGSRPQGISSCRNCHAQREQFCDRCHLQASVQPDCFGCHAY